MNPNLPTGETMSEGEPTESPMGPEDCVSLSALAMPGDDEQMAAPELGDKVQYTVEGTISRIEGDNAYITREAVNGEPVKGAAPMAPEAPDEMGELRGMAEGMKEEY